MRENGSVETEGCVCVCVWGGGVRSHFSTAALIVNKVQKTCGQSVMCIIKRTGSESTRLSPSYYF